MLTVHTQTAASSRSIVLLEEGLQNRLIALAEASSQTPEALATHAVREFVERCERNNRLSALAQKEWHSFEASGRTGGLEFEELSPWLNSWGSEDELPVPQSMTGLVE